RAPAVFDRPPQPHERRVRLGEGGSEHAPEPEPSAGAPGRVALTRGGPPHGEPRERGAQRTQHDRLEQSMSRASQTPGSVRPLLGRRIAVTRAREQAGELVRELEALGAGVVSAPAIRIGALRDLDPCPPAPARLAAWQLVVSL